jgi:hypothetical protein
MYVYVCVRVCACVCVYVCACVHVRACVCGVCHVLEYNSYLLFLFTIRKLSNLQQGKRGKAKAEVTATTVNDANRSVSDLIETNTTDKRDSDMSTIAKAVTTMSAAFQTKIQEEVDDRRRANLLQMIKMAKEMDDVDNMKLYWGQLMALQATQSTTHTPTLTSPPTSTKPASPRVIQSTDDDDDIIEVQENNDAVVVGDDHDDDDVVDGNNDDDFDGNNDDDFDGDDDDDDDGDDVDGDNDDDGDDDGDDEDVQKRMDDDDGCDVKTKKRTLGPSNSNLNGPRVSQRNKRPRNGLKI